jgi:hypothetical protein
MLQEARLLSKTRFMSIIKRGDKSDDASASTVQSLFDNEEEE